MPLRQAFAGYEVRTAYELGWSHLSNGDLLTQADSRFDLFLTTDQSLRYQQNLSDRVIAIMVLPTTSWPELRPHATQIAAAATALKPGEYHEFVLTH